MNQHTDTSTPWYWY